MCVSDVLDSPPLNFILPRIEIGCAFRNRQKSKQSFFYSLFYLVIFRAQTLYPMADRDTDELNIDNVIKKLLKGKGQIM